MGRGTGCFVPSEPLEQKDKCDCRKVVLQHRRKFLQDYLIYTESGVKTKVPRRMLVSKLFLSCLSRAPPEVLTELSLNKSAWTSTAGFSISLPKSWVPSVFSRDKCLQANSSPAKLGVKRGTGSCPLQLSVVLD